MVSACTLTLLGLVGSLNGATAFSTHYNTAHKTALSSTTTNAWDQGTIARDGVNRDPYKVGSRSHHNVFGHTSRSYQDTSRSFYEHRNGIPATSPGGGRRTVQPDNASLGGGWWDTPAGQYNRGNTVMGATSYAPGTAVTGDSLRTFTNAPYASQHHVSLTTDGRPLDTEVELWEGPNHAPTRLNVYSEDGYRHPFHATVGSYGRNGYSKVTSVRNTGPIEFPVAASVSSSNGPQSYGSGRSVHPTFAGMADPSWYTSTSQGMTIQGDGSLKTFSFGPGVDRVEVTLISQGMPIYATIELWGVGNHIKTIADLYNENGYDRPFTAAVELGSHGGTVAVRNTGPMAYPLTARVEPMVGYGRVRPAGIHGRSHYYSKDRSGSHYY